MKRKASKFWQTIPLEEMTEDQWESLCDDCAKCCLQKLEDILTNEVWYTNVVCRLFDLECGGCLDYRHRSERVPECVRLDIDILADPYWLPSTCAYRLVAEGKDLPSWHPLVSGDSATVIASGNSMLHRVVSEIDVDDLEDHVIDWVK